MANQPSEQRRDHFLVNRRIMLRDVLGLVHPLGGGVLVHIEDDRRALRRRVHHPWEVGRDQLVGDGGRQDGVEQPVGMRIAPDVLGA